MKTKQKKIEAAVELLRSRGYDARASDGMITIFGDISDDASAAIDQALKDIEAGA